MIRIDARPRLCDTQPPVRDEDDRGCDCVVSERRAESNFAEFQTIALKVNAVQQGRFGWVTHVNVILSALERTAS
jgi:hypothetical protein